MKSDSYIFTIHHQLFYETIFWGVNFLKKMSAKVFDNYVENASHWCFQYNRSLIQNNAFTYKSMLSKHL